MEMDRKRRRDEEDDKINESRGGKRQESCINPADGERCYEFWDGIGVFDFPWLKEGVIFKGEDVYLEENEQKLLPNCSYLDEDSTFTANFDQSCSQNLCVSPALDGNSYDNKLNDDSFWSLLVDDLEPVDCIWNCVLDQPLDMGFNKGLI